MILNETLAIFAYPDKLTHMVIGFLNPIIGSVAIEATLSRPRGPSPSWLYFAAGAAEREHNAP